MEGAFVASEQPQEYSAAEPSELSEVDEQGPDSIEKKFSLNFSLKYDFFSFLTCVKDTEFSVQSFPLIKANS